MNVWPKALIRSRLSRLPLIVLALAIVAGAWAAAAAQPHPAPAGVHIPVPSPRRSSPHELARKLAESIDAGDQYPTPSGNYRLRRSPGRVAVQWGPADEPTGRNWLAAGRPFAGYTVTARPGRQLAVLEAGAAETRRQAAEPARLRQLITRARSGAGTRTVNPVFVDSRSGRDLLVTEQVVICLKPGVNPSRYFGRAGKRVHPVWGAADQYLLSLPRATAEEVFAEVRRRARDPEVMWAEPDFIRQATKAAIPDDPYFAAKQWPLNNTGQGGGRPGADAKLPGAWDITTGSRNVVIAVLDDGCDIAHPDLAPNLFINSGEIPNNGIDDDNNGVIDDFNGYDFIGGKPDPSPVDPGDSHGTAVCGVAAAAGNNGQGGAGVAYGCQILPLKVIEGDFFLSDSSLAAVLRYAAGLSSSGVRVWRGADVINISLLFDPSFVVSTALTDAATRGRNGVGCSIFAAAGNSASAWQPYELIIDEPGTYTLRWEYEKDLTRTQGDDTVWIDGLRYPDGTVESFENGGLPDGWITGGAAAWTNVTQGVNGNRALTGWNGPASRSLRAGRIGGGQVTYVEVTTELTAGSFQFWAWVSTERDYDFFRFKVNGDEIFTDSGAPVVDTAVSFPASHTACFAVGASTDFDYRSDYSQYGVALDFLAPSDGGVSTVFATDRTGPDGYNGDFSPEGDYATDFGGTSASSPLAAGVAALVLSVNPHLTSGDMRALMRGTCDRIGAVTYDSAGRNPFYGSGRINAARAVAQARADLRVTLHLAAPLADVGGTTRYTITVQNLGPSRSGPVALTNVLPAGVLYGSATPSPASRFGNQLAFSLASLAPSAAAMIDLTVTNLTAGTNLFVAEAATDVLESDLANNTATGGTTVFLTPVLSIRDAAVPEGNRGVTNAMFAVELSNPSARPVTLAFLTLADTAVAGADFSPAKGVMTFQPGETNKSISVRVVGDARNEADESFFVVLTNVVHALVGRGVATGTILNDDPLPSLLVTNVAVKEGNSGLRRTTFKASLSAPSGRTVTVDYATMSGSAQAGVDFVATNGTLAFAPGKTSGKIVVSVNGDRVQESNLTFTVELSNPLNAALVADRAVGTILNNDKAPRIYIDDVSVSEGDAGTTNADFTVRLSAVSGLPVTVEFAATNGSALAGVDFVATNGELFFAPGQTNRTITVPVLGDRLSESNETFFVRLFNPTNVVMGDALAQATILDDDPFPFVNVSGPPPLAEPLAGTTNALFEIGLSELSGRTVVVKYATAAGTAAAGADFTARAGTLIFPPGTSNQTVAIAIHQDSAVEPDETFVLNLISAVNATLGLSTASCTITDSAAAPLPAGGAGLMVEAVRVGGRSALRMRFPTVRDRRYSVEGAEAVEGPWASLGAAAEIPGTGETVELVVEIERPQAFYRLRVRSD